MVNLWSDSDLSFTFRIRIKTMSGYFRIVLLLIALWVLYEILSTPLHPTWINAGDFLNYNANK